MADFELDLHGQAPDRGRVGYLLAQALAEAARRHAGLRIIHGRGRHVLAALVQSLLDQRRIAYAEGWRNPGETCIEPGEVARAASARAE